MLSTFLNDLIIFELLNGMGVFQKTSKTSQIYDLYIQLALSYLLSSVCPGEKTQAAKLRRWWSR